MNSSALMSQLRALASGREVARGEVESATGKVDGEKEMCKVNPGKSQKQNCALR